ncbi:MAG: tetratricopeptide repeat protein [Nitrospirota bacterium]
MESKNLNGVSDFDEGMDAFNGGDYAKAFALLKPIADQGHAEAQCIIGNLYHFGWGVERNVREAIRWYTKSSERGYGLASNNLGSIFMAGEGDIPVDRKAAERWYQKACQQGFPHSPPHK